MTDLNEYRDSKDTQAWAKRLVTDVNALSQRIRQADEAGSSLPHQATVQIGPELAMMWRSVVRMEMRGMERRR